MYLRRMIRHGFVVLLLATTACTGTKEEVCKPAGSGQLVISSLHGNNFGVAAELRGRYRLENGQLRVDADSLNLKQIINGYYGYVTVKQVRVGLFSQQDEEHFNSHALSTPLLVNKTFTENRVLDLGSHVFVINIDPEVPLDHAWVGIEIENADNGTYYAHTQRNFFASHFVSTGCLSDPCDHIETIEEAIEARCDAVLTRELEEWSYPVGAWFDRLRDVPDPVWVALNENNIAAMRILHSHDIDIDQVDKSGTTPLSLAAARGSVEMLKVLLELGANPNYAIPDGDQAGRTPLYGAISAQSPEIVELLLKHGGRSDLSDAYGWLPVHYAVYYDALPSLVALERSGANLDAPAPGKRGETPLMVAAQYAKLDAIKFLLLQGASLQQTDRYGKTAYDYAIFFGKQEAASLLTPSMVE